MADAFDVDFVDMLPAGMNFVSGSFVTGTVPSSINFGTSTMISYDSFPLGATSLFTIDARLDSSYLDSISITNTGLLLWTSLS